jgi:hypothetical protein
VYCPVSCASCVEILQFQLDSASRSWTIKSFSISDNGSVTILATVVFDIVDWVVWYQDKDCMMIGKLEVSMTVSFQLNFGSKLASQGYPRIRSSSPRSVTRNHIFAFFCPVWTLRST